MKPQRRSGETIPRIICILSAVGGPSLGEAALGSDAKGFVEFGFLSHLVCVCVCGGGAGIE